MVRGFGPATSITLDVHFDEVLNSSGFAHIVVELLKYLLQERKQIPLPYDRLKNETQRISAKLSHACGPVSEDPALGPRDRVKFQRKTVREATLDQRFLRQSSDYLQSLDRLVTNLTAEIVREGSENIKCIAIILGATPITSKEVYHIRPPRVLSAGTPPSDSGDSDWTEGDARKMRRKATIKLFKAMLMHEDFFLHVGKPLPLTNLFIAVQKRSTLDQPDASAWLVPQGEFGDIRRGKIVTLHFHGPAEPGVIPKTMSRKRLRFASEPSETPRRSGTLDGRYTPMDMELCTPAPGGLISGRKRRYSDIETPMRELRVDMVETPCHFSGDTLVSRPFLPCTPLFKNGPMDLSGMDEDTLGLDDEISFHMERVAIAEPTWFVTSKLLRGFKDPRLMTNKAS